MKNFMLFLVASFLLNLNTVFGQSKILLSPANQEHMDLVSLEIMGLMSEIMSETNLEELNKILAKGIGDMPGGVGEVYVEISFDVIVTDSPNQINLDSSIPMASATQQPILLTDSGLLEIMRSIPSLSNPKSSDRQSLFSNSKIVAENCRSIVCLDNRTGWIKLNQAEWEKVEKLKYQPKASTKGGWQVKVGPIEI